MSSTRSRNSGRGMSKSMVGHQSSWLRGRGASPNAVSLRRVDATDAARRTSDLTQSVLLLWYHLGRGSVAVVNAWFFAGCCSRGRGEGTCRLEHGKYGVLWCACMLAVSGLVLSAVLLSSGIPVPWWHQRIPELVSAARCGRQHDGTRGEGGWDRRPERECEETTDGDRRPGR